MNPAKESRPIPRWLRWLPWRYLVRRMARGGGFVDPVKIFSRFESFAQPLEVKEPLELLRAGLVFQARGILNTSAIQHNLDWVWPHWVERQYDPRDPAFVPRAFSLTHVNLTHRSWTATGLPGCEHLPIVDPRGLVTPFWDGWSIDAWVVGSGGRKLLPSRCADTSQRLRLTPGPEVVTHARDESFELESHVRVDRNGGEICCVVGLTAQGSSDASLVVSLRPYNPEGVSFIDEIALLPDEPGWALEKQRVRLSTVPSLTAFSDYRSGDVLHHLDHADDRRQIRCDVGMATAAALFPLPTEGSLSLEVRIPLEQETAVRADAAESWSSALSWRPRLRIPDERIAELYEQSIATLVLHTPGDVYPGPYTYKRFWFRDATFILHALLCAGLHDRVRSALERFPARQHASGFFHSQDGEWDSNGQVLWLFDRYQQLTGETLDEPWLKAIRRGARWIQRRRVADGTDLRHAGLMPAGFSAEHLGPNDFYYWDDFWSVAGLRAAARLLDEDPSSELGFRAEAEALLGAVERSLEQTDSNRPAMPASPYRRLDCGSIGSLAAGYPVEIFGAHDPRLLDTASYLLEHAFLGDAFFHDIIHSGINPYLTLHVAQVLLRAGDDRCVALMRAVANLASATGQWPEAVHPRTGGGCMGDGQHAWAAAEWFLYLRNCFVREESDRLVLASGIPKEWLTAGCDLALGPTPTRFGAVEVEVQPGPREIRVAWHGDWHRDAPRIEVAMFGHPAVEARGDEGAVSIERKDGS